MAIELLGFARQATESLSLAHRVLVSDIRDHQQNQLVWAPEPINTRKA